MRILTKALRGPLYKPYIKNDEFDEARSHADLERSNQLLKQWYEDHLHELDWVGEVALYLNTRRKMPVDLTASSAADQTSGSGVC